MKMKYKKLELNLHYEKYYESDKDTLNGYIKNRVYKTFNAFYIYVDFENVEYGRNKLIKVAHKKLEETLKSMKNFR